MAFDEVAHPRDESGQFASGGGGSGAKETWQMSAEEFDAHWEAETRRGLQEEADAKGKETEAEVARLDAMLRADPDNPGNGQIRQGIEQLKAAQAKREARVSGPVSKPSETMSPEQLAWHMGVADALREGKEVPQEVLDRLGIKRPEKPKPKGRARKQLQSVSAEEEEIMPDPKEGESEQDFVSRCVPIVMDEGTTQDQALGKCYGIYRNARKAVGTVDTMADAEEAMVMHPAIARAMRVGRAVQRAMILGAILGTHKALGVDPLQLYNGACKELGRHPDWRRALKSAVDNLMQDPDCYHNKPAESPRKDAATLPSSTGQ